MTDSFDIRNSTFWLRKVRHSKFVIRHCPDPHDATGRFDFVLANPPFNVNAVDKERLKDMVGPGRRFPFGLPRTDNANYLWIQLFHSALNEKGRAGFVMAKTTTSAHAFPMKIAEGVRKYTAGQDIAEEEALKMRMEAKSASSRRRAVSFTRRLEDGCFTGELDTIQPCLRN